MQSVDLENRTGCVRLINVNRAGEFDLFWTPILLRQAEARRGLRRSLPHFKIDCLIQVTLRIGKGITYKGLLRDQCN